MLANLQNGQLAKKAFIIQRRKKICETILNVLWDEGFILGYKLINNEPTKLKIFLKYNKNNPVIKSIKSVSRPGFRVYYSIEQLWKFDSSKTFLLISTNQGLKTLTQCKKLKIGGELFFIIS